MKRNAFRLASGIDANALADIFARDGRVQIAPFLHPDDADRLHAGLRARTDWRQIINSGNKTFDLDRATRDAMTDSQQAALDDAVWAGAREGFQYRFEAIRTPDNAAARMARGDPIDQFASFMSDRTVLTLLRHIAGNSAIRFADAQATAYSPGDFLTGHDDAVPGKDRHAAYVFGLTPIWRVEWGGLLLFHEDVALRGWPPSHNVLNLFAVPQLHSVSLVSRAAAFRRYAITGWLRSSASA